MTIEEKIETHINDVVSAKMVDFRKEVRAASIVNNSYLSRQEAAKYLSVSLATIDNQVRWGNLPKKKLGSSSRFKVSDLDALFINCKTA